MKNCIRIVLPVMLMLAFNACSQKPRSAMDTPEYHFRAGMRAVETEDFNSAASSFQRALELNRKFAPGHAGLALVEASRGNANAAKTSINRALMIGQNDADVLVLCARAWIALRPLDRTWYSQAQTLLTKALRKDSKHEAALYYYGMANLYGYNFVDAEKYFKQLVDRKGEYAARGNEKWELSQKIVRAMPGTDAGKRVALQSKITRADLAVLFAEELKISELIAKLPPPPAGFQTPSQMAATQQQTLPPDVEDHWAATWIRELLRIGVMEAGPDGKFYPNETISRANYAVSVQKLLVVATRDHSLETRYFGESPSRFSDVPSSHFAYNAMALCAERGIMQADVITGRFNPGGTISGADALLIVRTLQNSLRQTF